MPERLYVPTLDENGNAVDGRGRILATKQDLASYANLPANTTLTLTKANGEWPGAPTTRADTVIVWKGAEPSPPIVSSRTLGQPGMLNNVDLRIVT